MVDWVLSLSASSNHNDIPVQFSTGILLSSYGKCKFHCNCQYEVLLFVFCSSANKCLLKVAMYSAQMGEYAKALEIYEQVSYHKIKKKKCFICNINNDNSFVSNCRHCSLKYIGKICKI